MENVTEVMAEVVGDREWVWVWLDVPQFKQTKLMQQSSTVGEKTRALTQYWVKCVPHPTWKGLTHTLYFSGEERAAVMAKQYLPKGMCIS